MGKVRGQEAASVIEIQYIVHTQRQRCSIWAGFWVTGVFWRPGWMYSLQTNSPSGLVILICRSKDWQKIRHLTRKVCREYSTAVVHDWGNKHCYAICIAVRQCQKPGQLICLFDCTVTKQSVFQLDQQFVVLFQVCSSFNKTYDSECHLYRQRCLCQRGLPGCTDPKNKDMQLEYLRECRGK